MRVLNRWNSLPQSAVQVNSVNCFKNQLEKIRTNQNQMDFFSWTISPLIPLAAEWKDLDRSDDMRRFRRAAAPGEVRTYWTTRGYAKSRIANSRTGHLADW